MQPDILKSVYDFVAAYIEANGYPPSIREIAAECFISPMTVSSTLRVLEAHGKIARTEGKARAIRILRKD